MFKRFLMLLFLGVFSFSHVMAYASGMPSNPYISAKEAIAVDLQTGQILYHKNEQRVAPVASMSKLLSTYIILSAVKSGQLSWDQKIKISPEIARLSEEPALANVSLVQGQTYSLRSLLNASLVYSANAAMMAIAIQQAGSSASFSNEMKMQLKQWGINNFKMYNAAGLTEEEMGSVDLLNKNYDENEMSAKDMVIVVRHLISDYPNVLNIIKKYHYNFISGGQVAQRLTNHNEMLQGGTEYEKDMPLEGLKTGTSMRGGACFTGLGVIDGHEVVTVVMGSKNNGEGLARFSDTKAIIKYIKYHLSPVVFKSNNNFGSAFKFNVDNAKKRTNYLSTKQDFYYWLFKNDRKLDHKLFMDHKKLDAPISKKGEVATAQFTNRKLSYFMDGKKYVKVRMHPSRNIKQANLMVLIIRNLLHLFGK